MDGLDFIKRRKRKADRIGVGIGRRLGEDTDSDAIAENIAG